MAGIAYLEGTGTFKKIWHYIKSPKLFIKDLFHSLFKLTASPFIIIRDWIRYPKQFFEGASSFFKGLFWVIIAIIGLIVFFLILSLFQPVWDGIGNGFSEVWNNIKDSWLVFIIKNLLIYLFILIFLLFQIFIPILLGCLLGIIPSIIINYLLKIITKRDEIPLLSNYPRDTLEIIYLSLTIACCSILAICIFMNYFMETVTSINYGPF